MPGVDVHTHLAPVLAAELASQVHGFLDRLAELLQPNFR
jgi:hypothetical protein